MKESVDRLTATFEASARRWEMVVYPSLFAFIILAAYGFYLVYSLSKDVHYLAISVDTHMTVLASNMQSVAENMGAIAQNVNHLDDELSSINVKMEALEGIERHMSVIDGTLNTMNHSVINMQHATRQLSTDMHRMQRPFSGMSKMMPW